MSGPDTDDIEDSAAPLIEHLAELRTRLIRSVVAFLIAMSLCFIPIGGQFIAEHILNFVLQPVCTILVNQGRSCELVFLAPQEYFFLIRISLIFGFAFAFPIIGYQMWRFVAPGLYRSEKAAFMPFLIASPMLFLVGAAFTHFVVTPLAMSFLIGFADFAPTVAEQVAGDVAQGTPPPPNASPEITFQARITDSLDLSLKFIFAFGLCFQLPVLLTLMGKAGLVSVAGLRNMRKYAVVAILTLAAVITPPDVITQVILFSVVYALYEISILLVKRVEKKRNDELRAQGLLDEDEDPSVA